MRPPIRFESGHRRQEVFQPRTFDLAGDAAEMSACGVPWAEVETIPVADSSI